MWKCVEDTLRTVVLPALSDEFARASVVHLVGLARYATERGPDHSVQRVAEVAAALDALSHHALVARHWTPTSPRTPDAVMDVAAYVLADCAGIVGDDDDAAADVRAALRTLLVTHLDEDLAGNAVLLSAFRGRLPDA